MCADHPGNAEAGPSILDLIRLSPRELLPLGGRELYGAVAHLAGLGRHRHAEVIDVACGDGAQLAYLVEEFGVQGAGVDTDVAAVTRGEERSRSRGLGDRLQFQEAPLGRLPYRDEVFDVAIGELGLAASPDPRRALAELVRVTRPGGTLVLLQLVWKSPVSEDLRRRHAETLGVVPRTLAAWKRLLAEAGVEDLHVSDWSVERTAASPEARRPFPDFAELFTLREKLAILRRVRRIWGWSGVRTALDREWAVHRLLAKEKVLGFVVIKGVRAAMAAVEGEAATSGDRVRGDAAAVGAPRAEVAGAGLPLFGGVDSTGLVEPRRAEAVPRPPKPPKPIEEPRAPQPAVVPAPARVEDLPLFSDEREVAP